MASHHQLSEYVWLIGNPSPDIIGNKLPTNQQVLQVHFYNMRNCGISAKVSASSIYQQVVVFWEMAHLPTLRKDKCVAKILKLYHEYLELQKHRGRSSNQPKEAEFGIRLESLFDISPQNSENLVEQEVYDFLVDQRSDRNLHIENVFEDFTSPGN